MLNLVRLLVTLAGILPLDEIAALFRAATPFPTDWRDKDLLAAWLQRVGVVDPLAPVVVDSVCTQLALAQETGPVTEADVKAIVEAEARAAGLDPATIAMLVQLAVQILKALGILK